MVRSAPWRAKCPPAIAEKMGRVESAQMLMLHQPGPTSFVISDNATDIKQKVLIGDKQHCTCMDFKKSKDLCVHVLFVMMRVLRVPKDNAMVWQQSLLEAEVDQIVSGRTQRMSVKPRGFMQQSEGGDGDAHGMKAKPIEEDEDECPICCEFLLPSGGQPKPVWHCRYGCGNNVHVDCFKQYAQHHMSSRTSSSDLQCPLCRSKWGPMEKEAKKPVPAPAYGVSCRQCHQPVPRSGALFRCVFCTSFDLCEACYDSASMNHLHHPFNSCELPGANFAPARAPRRPLQPVVTRATTQPSEIHPLMTRDLGPEDYEELLRLDESLQRPVLSQSEALSLATEEFRPGMAHDTCPVCLEAFDPRDTINVLPCDHALHHECAVQWFTTGRAACPIDNTPVSSYPQSQHNPQTQPQPQPARADPIPAHSSHAMLNMTTQVSRRRSQPNQRKPLRPGNANSGNQRKRSTPFQPQMGDLLVVGGGIAGDTMAPQTTVIHRSASGGGLGAVRQLRPHQTRTLREKPHTTMRTDSNFSVEGRTF